MKRSKVIPLTAGSHILIVKEEQYCWMDGPGKVNVYEIWIRGCCMHILRLELFVSLTPSHQVFICLTASISIVIVDPVNIILRLACSNHYNLAFHNHQAHWFQSQQFSELCIFLPFFHCKPTYPSDLTHFRSDQLYLMLHFQVSLQYAVVCN